MVEVVYLGNLGNNLFQYCFGRILAEKFGYQLKSDPIAGFPHTKEIVQGKNYSKGCKRLIIANDFSKFSVSDNPRVVWQRIQGTQYLII